MQRERNKKTKNEIESIFYYHMPYDVRLCTLVS